MGFLSIQFRTRLWQITLASIIVILVWLVQTDLLTRFSLKGLLCNLPLTFTILWGAVFGSRLRGLSTEEIRALSVGEIAIYQALAGSRSGLCIGLFFAALYNSALPIFPICYPLIGWIAGYFNLKNVSQPAFLSIPLVLLASILAEFISGCQIFIWQSLNHISAGQDALATQILSRFAQIAMPEAILNALIAPIIVIPMRTWYEFWTSREVSVPE